jgi:hypothetical protein
MHIVLPGDMANRGTKRDTSIDVCPVPSRYLSGQRDKCTGNVPVPFGFDGPRGISNVGRFGSGNRSCPNAHSVAFQNRRIHVINR